MLPVYLDHVFHPTLTSEGFVTEVYHVNGKGEDAGVVYSEMQGRENSSGDLMQLEYQRKLYQPSSGYRSETGGLMSALRVLTIDDIRQYHHKYYAPYNTAVVVCGPLDRTELLDKLQATEDSLVEHGVKGVPNGWKRPFVDTASAQIPKIAEKRTQIVVDFPEKDESVGEVMVAWLGPRVDEWEVSEALGVLGTYLTDSAVSPIQNALVERDDPQCTEVYFSTSDKAGASTIEVYLTNVPAALIKNLDVTLVDDVLTKVTKYGVDMTRMKTLIARERSKLLNQLETKPADSFADVIITDFLYGHEDGHDLKASMDSMKRFDALEDYSSSQWVQILKTWLIDNPRVVVCGKPSAKMAEKIKKDTQALVEKRKTELGEDGLAQLGKALQEAQKANDIEVPKEMLSNFDIPNVGSINWINVGTVTEGSIRTPLGHLKTEKGPLPSADEELRKHLDNGSQYTAPFFVQWNQIPSNFVTLNVLLNTTSVSPELRPLMNLFLSSIFSLPVEREDGTKLSFEEVVKQLDEDTLEYDASLGVGAGFAEMVCIEIKVEKTKYTKGIEWLYDLLWRTELSVDRIKVNAAKIAQSLPEQKRDGRTISWALARSLTHSDHLSTNLLNNVLTQGEVIPKIVEQLSSPSTSSTVIDQLEKLRQSLLKPEKMLLSVAGDVISLQQPKEALQSMAKKAGWSSDSAGETEKVPLSRDVLTTLGKQPCKKGVITPLSTLESSFAVFIAKGIDNFQGKDYAALAVTISALNAMESYLWRYIRGAGLAYGASIRSDPEANLIYFSLYRSPDSAKAFAAAADVINQLVNGSMEIGEDVLESAKSSMCFGVADSEGTVSLAAGEAFSDSVLRGTGKGRGRRLIEAAKSVTVEQVKECLAKYIQPIFDPATSICAVASSPGRLEEMKAALEKAGYEIDVKELNFSNDEEEGDDDSQEGSESSEQSDTSMGDGSSKL
jgi:Zn-dependent M16 (insulinase) family peptidase